MVQKASLHKFAFMFYDIFSSLQKTDGSLHIIFECL